MKPRPCISGQIRCDARPDQVFECDQCHKEVCCCQGGSDELPDSCAECFAKFIIVHEDPDAQQEKA